MWSGPRTVSTALMRAWENRPDTVVTDEPLYAFYLERTGIYHPGRDEVIASQPTDWRVVLTRLTSDPLPPGVSISYAKHMTHHLLPEVDRGELVDGLRAYPLAAFEEKPGPARARELATMPGVAWNAGMFLWRRPAIIEALGRHAPAVLDGVQAGLFGDLASAYAALPSVSIDYAVMEPAAAVGQVVMAAMDVGWTDVGTWSALLEVLGAPGVEGCVVEAGHEAATAPGDLIIERVAGRPVVREAVEGSVRPAAPVAILKRARDTRPLVEALLERCAAAESAV